MGVSGPLGHLQELGSGVYHCRACCWSGFDQSSAFVVERRYFISADSKRRWSLQGYCHRTCLPSHSSNKRRTKANDQPNYVLFPLTRLLRVIPIFIIAKYERHHAGLISEQFPISRIFVVWISKLTFNYCPLKKILSIVHLKFMPLCLVIETSPVNIQGLMRQPACPPPNHPRICSVLNAFFQRSSQIDRLGPEPDPCQPKVDWWMLQHFQYFHGRLTRFED